MLKAVQHSGCISFRCFLICNFYTFDIINLSLFPPSCPASFQLTLTPKLSAIKRTGTKSRTIHYLRGNIQGYRSFRFTIAVLLLICSVISVSSLGFRQSSELTHPSWTVNPSASKIPRRGANVLPLSILGTRIQTDCMIINLHSDAGTKPGAVTAAPDAIFTGILPPFWLR